MSRERLVAPEEGEGDKQFNWGLRPKTLDEYVGQAETVERLKIAIRATLARGETLDHLLLHGPPGLGKTTLAYIIAQELGREIALTSGPALERPGDVMGFLVNAKQGDIIFIDEIHRLPRIVEEFLYSAMEDYIVNFTLDKGMYSKPLPFQLQQFTLIGATTRPAMLTRPLRDRFGIQQHFDFYTEAELIKIVRRSAHILDTEIDKQGAEEIARRARGTPRVANRLLRRVRDYALVRAGGEITLEVACAALDLLDVDRYGLDEVDQKLMLAILDKFNGGPVGLGTIAAATDEETDTIEEVYEPYLIQLGFLERTPRGRVGTMRAFEYFGLRPRGIGTSQDSLF